MGRAWTTQCCLAVPLRLKLSFFFFVFLFCLFFNFYFLLLLKKFNNSSNNNSNNNSRRHRQGKISHNRQLEMQPSGCSNESRTVLSEKTGDHRIIWHVSNEERLSYHHDKQCFPRLFLTDTLHVIYKHKGKQRCCSRTVRILCSGTHLSY